MLIRLNEYGALLDMHQDETMGEITKLQKEFDEIYNEIKDLELSQVVLKNVINDRRHQRDLYLKMRELIGHAK